MVPLPLPLRRRQLPFAASSPPMTGVVAPTSGRASRGLAVAGRPYWLASSRPCPWVAAPDRGPGRSRLPLAGSQAMAGCPYRGTGHGQPPLHADNMHVAAPSP
ncbi:hypothetical protein B296_00038547 [Ensete ventricosum]|uniref:Uncharacterized protein n=1 Tax=Ensete ventricosum TaxID=4639 RepID=A0A426X5H2_ENSVE|nr:hypothetical protein B296_00038547 [Ensete ventricosum]